MLNEKIGNNYINTFPNNISKYQYSIDVIPSIKEVEHVTSFIETSLTSESIPLKIIFQFNIAVDEIFSNIVHYSGATKATISCNVQKNIVSLCFKDNGIPFDPLAKLDPDISQKADERKIGGLGIYMVKKSMSSMDYHYLNGENILSMYKILD